MANGRKKRNRGICVIAVAVLLALLLMACGSGKEDSTKDTDTQGAAKPEKKTEDTQAEQPPDSDSPEIGGDMESKGTPVSGLSVLIEEVLETSFMGKEIQTDDQGDAGRLQCLTLRKQNNWRLYLQNRPLSQYVHLRIWGQRILTHRAAAPIW